MVFVATGPPGNGRHAECLSCDARSHSVCNAIKNKDVARLAGLATVVEVKAGGGFIHEGDAAEHFFNVAHGDAKLYKLMSDGRRQLTGFVRTGDFLGLAAGKNYSFSAEALDPVRVCRFSRKKLTSLFDDFPAMERRLLEAASNDLLAAQNQMLLLGRKTARERVASFLGSQAALAPSCHQGDRLPLSMTRGDIADYLGLTIETVSRTMTALRKSGVIKIPSSSEVTIQDTAALKSIADGTIALD
jgi:CRP/FNR family transcriptional regulator